MISFAIALCFQQEVLKDVHIPAMPIEKAVVQLSAIYNSPMDISTLLKGKVILIDATQVSESEVRDQIGKTINASWEKKENLWHLTKTAKQQAADIQRGAEMRSRFMRKTLEIREKALNEKPEITQANAVQLFHQLRNEQKRSQEDRNAIQPPGPTAAAHGLPTNRFMSRFLLRFGVERISAVPNGHRQVFALHPNAMQSPMGFDVSDLIAKYRSEQQTWMNAAIPILKDQEGGTPPQGATEAFVRSSEQLRYGLDASFSPVPANLKDLLFSVYCSEDGAYQLQLFAIPDNNIDGNYHTISATSYEGAFAGMEAGDFDVKPVEGFKLSQDSEDFKNFRENNFQKVPIARQAPLLAKLADPVTRDPLSYGLTESLVFDARRLKRNIVALVSDSQLNVFEPIFGDMLLDDKYKALIQDFAQVDEKWIRMFDAPYAEQNMPRTELKRIIANARANKKVGVFDRAAIASFRPRTNAYSYVEGLLDRFANTQNRDFNDSDALKLIGLLSESERSAAFRPEGIRYNLLNAKAQQHLYECCFYNERNRLGFPKQAVPKRASAAFNEATLRAPNGIESEAVLCIEEIASTEIKDPDEPGQQNLSTDAKGWGSTLYQIDHPDEFPGANFKFDKSRKLFRLQKTKFEFKFRINPISEWQASLAGSESRGSDSFTIDNFPADLKADFEAGYKATAEGAKLRKERLKNKGGGGTRQNQS